MEMKLKNKQLIDLFDAMKQISETQKNNKWFTYAITLNEEQLKSKVIAILECGKPLDEYKNYEIEREKLIRQYAEQDDNGNFVVDRLSNLIKIKDEYVLEAKEKFNKLDEENKDILEQRKLDLDAYYKILDKEITVQIEQVSITEFPETINKIMMKALLPMIKNEN